MGKDKKVWKMRCEAEGQTGVKKKGGRKVEKKKWKKVNKGKNVEKKKKIVKK